MLRLPAPPSKSVTHRALLLAALADGDARVRRPLLGADNLSTLHVLRGLGCAWTEEADGSIRLPAFRPAPPDGPLDCGNSGTTLRLMAGQVARFPFETTLTGDASLRSRPNGPLLDALAALGAEVHGPGGRAPLRVRGPLRSGRVALPGGLSSQYASSLALALAMTEGPSEVALAAPVASRPYLDLTLAMARDAGLRLDLEEDDAGLRIRTPGGDRPSRLDWTVEGDWSGAAFPAVAAAVAGREVAIEGLDAGSAQGDRALVDLLRRFGAETELQGDALLVRGGPLRSAGRVDVGATPDLFPALCVLAACAEGETRIDGSPGLRHKECDRIAAMAEGLLACGVPVDELPDGLVVRGAPGAIRGAAVRTHEDHRIHMAFAVLGLAARGPMQPDHPGCVVVSYPDFHDHLARLRGLS